MNKEVKGTYTFEKNLIGKDKIPALISFHKQEKPMPAVIYLHGWTGSKEGITQLYETLEPYYALTPKN